MTLIRKSLKRPSQYFAEFNRARGDNIARTATRLTRRGIEAVTRPRHLTTVEMTRPASMSFSEFAAILKTELQPRIGSAILFSCRTGNVFICDNKSNRPNVFRKISH